jgi:hypothetical protein
MHMRLMYEMLFVSQHVTNMGTFQSFDLTPDKLKTNGICIEVKRSSQKQN